MRPTREAVNGQLRPLAADGNGIAALVLDRIAAVDDAQAEVDRVQMEIIEVLTALLRSVLDRVPLFAPRWAERHAEDPAVTAEWERAKER